MGHMTVAAARERLREALEAGERVDCPCCDRPAKQYKRKVHAGMAAVLIAIYREGRRTKDGWVSVVDIYDQGWSGASDYAKLRFWGLIECFDRRTADENASGLWRITPFGKRFVKGTETIPKYVVLYANELIRVVEDSEQVNIWDCLADEFDYADLMRGR